MSEVRKISWQDGMFIYPHHFQQQDLCLQSLIGRHHAALPYFSYGLLEFVLDDAALRMNTILIKKCAGILPDGTIFHAPDKDALPKPIVVPLQYNEEYVYLGLVLDESANSNLDQRERDLQFRYMVKRHQFLDLHSKDKESKDIDVCKLNLNILLSTNDLNGLSYLPILKISNAADGIILDAQYIPPTIRAQSSNVLQSLIVRVLSMLHGYVNTHFQFLRTKEAPQYSDKSERWLIFQTVHRYQYLFALCSQNRHLLPYQLFELMVDLVGSLRAFTTDSVFAMPKMHYDHNDLSASFQSVLDLIEGIFAILGKQMVVKLDFVLTDNLHMLQFPQDLDLSNADFILSISFKEQFERPQHLFKHVKIATVSEIKKIIAAQVSGVRFTRLQELSPYVTSEKDTIYVQLIPEGYLWDQVLEQRDLSIYTSAEAQHIRGISLWMIAK
jgi:type VI secretion system protein ImpJ